MTYEVTIDGRLSALELRRDGEGWNCRLEGREIPLDVAVVAPDVLSLLIEGKVHECRREQIGEEKFIWVGNRRYAVEVQDPRTLRALRGSGAEAAGPRKVKAPMPGRVVRILVGEGDAVEAGQGLVVVEAMKMQNEMKSPKAGVVRDIAIAEGASVNAGDLLLVVE